MFCGDCGNGITVYAKFCSKCGKETLASASDVVNVDVPNHGNSCDTCGDVSPLKYCSFSQNIGLVLIRLHKNIQGNLCKSCIDNYFAKFTLITFIFGWWGIISFFVTAAYLLNNVFVFLGTASLERRRDDNSSFKAWSVFSLVVIGVTFVVYKMVTT